MTTAATMKCNYRSILQRPPRDIVGHERQRIEKNKVGTMAAGEKRLSAAVAFCRVGSSKARTPRISLPIGRVNNEERVWAG